MRRLIWTVFLMPFVSHAQRIEENKVDEFTKNRVIRTSWEMLARDDGFYVHVRTSKIDSSLYLNFKWLQNEGVSIIYEGARMMVKLDNDSIITLRTLKSAVSCRGCGAVGFAGSQGLGYDLTFALNADDISSLKRYPIEKIRFYLTDGYVEHNIKSKFADVLVREISIIPFHN